MTTKIIKQNALDSTGNLLEEENFIEENIPEDISDIQHEAAKKISIQRKILAIIIAIITYIICLPAFLPYQNIANWMIHKHARFAKITFSDLNINLFSEDKVRDLNIQMPDGSFFRTETLSSTINILNILRHSTYGILKSSTIQADIAGMQFYAKSSHISLNMFDILDNILTWKGDAVVQIEQMKIDALPEKFKNLPIPISAQDLKIEKLLCKLAFEKDGIINMNGSSVDSNIFDASITGTAKLTSASNIAQINVKLCIKPDSKLADTNKPLLDLFSTLSGNRGAETCLMIEGPPGNVQFRMLK